MKWINREVSAVLLVPIRQDRCTPVGILHPDALCPFDIFSLPLVPLLHLRSWPIEKGLIVIQWTWESDPPYPYHKRIRALPHGRATAPTVGCGTIFNN